MIIMPTAEYNTSDYLKTNEEITEYLNAALEENDPKLFLTALNNVIEATKKITQINQENKLLEKSDIGGLLKVFRQLGIKLNCGV